jgi:hypothetical protein
VDSFPKDTASIDAAQPQHLASGERLIDRDKVASHADRAARAMHDPSPSGRVN